MRAFLKSRLKNQRELNLNVALLEVERAYVEEALRRNDGNIMEAAKSLGIGRSSVYRILDGQRAKDGILRGKPKRP